MQTDDDLAISIADITILGRCRKMRTWFRDNDLDEEFKTLIKGGTIPASKLKATGDPRADQVIKARMSKNG